MSTKPNIKIAIIHDYLCQFGGAERVLLNFHSIFPDAPIYTSIYDRSNMPDEFKALDIRTSFMQSIPCVSKIFRMFFWLYPFAFNSLDLSGYDVILSSSSAFAKGVGKAKGAKHFCYCYNPMRFVWRYDDYVKNERWGIFDTLIKKILLPILFYPLKKWDYENSKQVDYFLTSSKVVAKRIKETYGREAEVINPPVDTDFYQPAAAAEIAETITSKGIRQPYYLVVSRLAGYKRVDLAIEAFNQSGQTLVIVGTGPQEKVLSKTAKENVFFLGKCSDSEIRALYSGCEALIFAGDEDYGLVPLEAMACGVPVIAFRAGGATETVLENTTGLFFDRQTAEELLGAVRRIEKTVFDPKRIREQALTFSTLSFTMKIRSFIITQL